MGLIEVIVAFTILLITVLPLTYLLTSAVSSAANSRQRQAALQLADSWLEVLSNSSLPTTNGAVITNQPQDPATFTGISAATTQIPKSTLPGTNFTVRANFTEQSVNNQGQSDLCSSGQPPSPSHPAVILLQVTVSWNDGNNSVTDTTAVDYPQPGLQTQGFLAVQTSNSGGTDALGNLASDRLAAVPITLTETAQGSSTDPWVSTSHSLNLYPDENGCVFAQVPTGTYTVTAGQPSSGTPPTFTGYSGTPAFVDTANSTTDTNTTQVTVTAESVVTLDAFDEGISTSISYGASSAVDGGVTCPGTNSIPCVATGNGTSGAAAAWGGTGANWSSSSFANISNLASVACTSSNSPTCVGVGYSSSGGVIRTTSSDLSAGSVSSDTVPAGVTDITQVTCPSANGCYAFGTIANGPTASTPVLLAGAVGQAQQLPPQVDQWAIVSPPFTTFTALNSLACPTTTTCELSGSATVGASTAPVILRLDGDPATLATTPTWTPTFTLDTLPTTVTVQSVGQLDCPNSTLCEAVATVTDPVSTFDPTVLTASIAPTLPSPATPPPSTWANESTFPTGAGSITDISCTSTTCLAIGTNAGQAAVWTADLTQAPHDWSTNSTFPTESSLSAVACGQPAIGDTADCVVTAVSSSASAPGQLIEGSLSANGGWAWNAITLPLPTGTSVLYYTGAACESSPSSSRATCAAVGATASGPIVVTTDNGPAGNWSIQTPSSLPGALVTGIPLETAPASINTWTTQVAAGGATNATTLGKVLYPQPGGYSIAAGDCASEAVGLAPAALSAAPGGLASATVPLGLLALQVVNPFGIPITGATVNITSTLCSADSYTLPVTDAFGLTQTSVPYGTYSYTVTSAGATTTPASPNGPVTLSVSTSSVTKLVNGVANPATYLPNPVVVASS